VRCLNQLMQSSAFSRGSRSTTAGWPSQDPLARRVGGQSESASTVNRPRLKHSDYFRFREYGSKFKGAWFDNKRLVVV